MEELELEVNIRVQIINIFFKWLLQMVLQKKIITLLVIQKHFMISIQKSKELEGGELVLVIFKNITTISKYNGFLKTDAFTTVTPIVD